MFLTFWGVINKVLKRSLHSDKVMSPASNPHKTALAPSLLDPWSFCSDFNPFYSLGAMLCSVMSDCDPMDCSLPGSCPWNFPRQEYWSGLPFPSPGDLPDPLIETTTLASPALSGIFFTTVPLGKPINPLADAFW